MQNLASIAGDKIKIQFSYDPILVALVKSLPGRRFVPEPGDKYWTIPLDSDASECVAALREKGFSIDGELKAWIAKQTKEEPPPDPTKLNLPDGAYPFQKDGVRQVERWRGRALIADDPGLGKTIQALIWIHCHPELKPALLVVPATVKINWRRETLTWAPGRKSIIIYGRKDDPLPENLDIVIVNYDILNWSLKREPGELLPDFKERDKKTKRLYHDLIKIQPAVMVIDECHYISNPQTLRSEAVKALGKISNNIIAMSGTPATSRPVQFFPILNMLAPKIFPSFWKYAHRYCDAKHNGYGWNFNGASNTEELHKLLTETVMIRRRKQDVLKDLPDKIHTVLPLEIDNREEYALAETNFHKWLKTQGTEPVYTKAEALIKREKLRQLAGQGKMNSIIAWVRDFLESSEEKLILFTKHIRFRDQLYKEFPEISVMGKGGDSTQDAADTFQNDKSVRLFIATMDAAGEGISLTAASHLAFVELDGTPKAMKQAADRPHRIGQKNCVNIYYFVAEKTVEEEKIAAVLDQKTGVLSRVLDGKETDEDAYITNLLKKHRGEKR